MKTEGIRLCAVCGTFYPDEPTTLREMLRGMMRDVKPKKKRIRGIVAPHAGYVYSGRTAALAYGRLAGSEYSKVIILAPSHQEYFPGASVYRGHAYSTPLGVVPIDQHLKSRLLELCPLIREGEEGHREEHAVEVHLPFLQMVLQDFSFVPLVIGDQSPDIIRRVGEALAKIMKEEDVLVVASTDLSHFHTAQKAETLDTVAASAIQSCDPDWLMSDLESGLIEMCGGGPVASLLIAARDNKLTKVEVVDRCNSGLITGDMLSVVGYLSAVITEN